MTTKTSSLIGEKITVSLATNLPVTKVEVKPFSWDKDEQQGLAVHEITGDSVAARTCCSWDNC